MPVTYDSTLFSTRTTSKPTGYLCRNCAMPSNLSSTGVEPSLKAFYAHAEWIFAFRLAGRGAGKLSQAVTLLCGAQLRQMGDIAGAVSPEYPG